MSKPKPMPNPPSRRRVPGTAVHAVVATAIAVAGTAVVALPAAASTPDTSPPRIGAVTFSRTSVAVRGLAVVPVKVSVRLTDPSGVAETGPGMSPSPEFTLSPVPGFRSRLHPALTRTSGTPTDGVWSATVHVPSTWHGTVRVSSVRAADRAGNAVTAETSAAAALRVVGTHRPALTLRYTPLAAGGFRIHGRAYYADTGRPIKSIPLATAYDSGCDFAGGAADNIRTDARGRYEKRWPGGTPAAAGCVALTGRAAPGQHRTILAYRVASAPRPSIPDAAMLQPEDLRGATPAPITDDYWSALRPPQPCGPYRSTAQRRTERAISALIGVNDRPTVVMEDVAVYRAHAAHRYLGELRRAVASCAETEPQWTVRATGVAGDESLLLERREYIDFAEVYKSTYVVVARVGQALVVVADAGWETSSGHEPLVRELGVRAVSRAQVLNHG